MADQFSVYFSCDLSLNINNIEFLTLSYHEHCSTILDKIARIKARTRVIYNTSPWMMDAVCCLRWKCCRTEWLLKATGLDVHFLYFKELLYYFKASVREAWPAYFANAIYSSKRNLQVLSDTINKIVSPPLSTLPCFVNDCKFLTFFVDIVMALDPVFILAHDLPIQYLPWSVSYFSGFFSTYQLCRFNGLDL